MRLGALLRGRRDDEVCERRMRQFLTWCDMYVGWPTNIFSVLVDGWLDVFQHVADQRYYYGDHIRVSEILSITEARGFHKEFVLSEKEFRDAERRLTEKAITSESVPERPIAFEALLRVQVGLV